MIVIYTCSMNSESADGALAALLGEGARLFDRLSSHSSMEWTPPGASKTPTTPVRVADLVAARQYMGAMWKRAITVRIARDDTYSILYPCAHIHCRKNCKTSSDLCAFNLSLVKGPLVSMR